MVNEETCKLESCFFQEGLRDLCLPMHSDSQNESHMSVLRMMVVVVVGMGL